MVPLLENEDQIDEEHRAAFQANYAAEITRQRSLLMSNTKLKMAAPLTDSSDILHMLSTKMECDKEVECNIWEDA
jgi:hypothetical protein